MFFIPSKHYIQNLQPGDYALDAFGKLSKVVSITCKELDIHGRLFVHYYTQFSDNGSTCSMSQKEGRLTRTSNLDFTSHQLDDIEFSMKSVMVAKL